LCLPLKGRHKADLYGYDTICKVDDMYEKELGALKKAGRFRIRKQFDEGLADFASNDYLGLAKRKKSFTKAVKMVEKYATFAPKASMLVNGYHPIHQVFEERLCRLNGFESGLVVGSGFLANLALIEALVRKGDRLFLDEEYHASGQLAAQLHPGQVVTFTHNDAEDLKKKLLLYPAKRRIVAVEGVYSMGGDLCSKEIFEVADAFESLLIVDEAHSSGVIGEKLLGIFEHYGISPHERHIKMGTLGKAYGSYGAYILASKMVISFLENRAKSVIYATAPSVFDTALALVNIEHVSQKAVSYRKRIDRRLEIVEEILGVKQKSLVLPIPLTHNTEALQMQKMLMEKGFLVGAIRQPTVDTPILRIIPGLGVSRKHLRELLQVISDTSLQ